MTDPGVDRVDRVDRVVAQVRTAYDVVADDYAARFPDTAAEGQLLTAMLDAFAAEVRGRGRVLDAGCGTGRITRYLRGRGCEAEGMDLSPAMLAEARRSTPDAPFALGSLTRLPYADASFAGVLLWYSAIHVPPAAQEQVYAEVARVLAPGGHVIVGFQHGTGVRDVGQVYRTVGLEVELERHLFTADQVAGWLAAVGVTETARLVVAGLEGQRDPQATVIGRSTR